jgi:hypothetical protein
VDENMSDNFEVNEVKTFKILMTNFLTSLQKLMEKGSEFDKRIGVNQLITVLNFTQSLLKENQNMDPDYYEKVREILVKKNCPFHEDIEEMEKMLSEFGLKTVPSLTKLIQGKKIASKSSSRKKQMERKFRSKQ